VIDGKPGENVRQAVAAFQEAHGMAPDGQLSQAVFDKLTAADTAPALKNYVIADADVKGPFEPIPHDFKAQSELEHMGYQSAQELLAEKFHMTEELLAELNPGVDFARAGQTITVAAIGDDTLPAQVALIEVDKAESAVKAYDAKGALLAFYPATIGSDERPAPTGAFKVANVAQDPTYVFDPKRLTFKEKGITTRTTLPPGPNNPVGAVWIGLSIPTYGIHGVDEPKEVGKRFSHGCVRLTNWDAEELASRVKAGVKVSFVDASPAGLRAQAAKAAAGKPAA
jgi:lipoprotein-anchoring transpeptidase ErfK/SrfK